MIKNVFGNIRGRLNDFVNEFKSEYNDSVKHDNSKLASATGAFLKATEPMRQKITESAVNIKNRVKEGFQKAVAAIGDSYAKHEMTANFDANKYKLAYQTSFKNLDDFAFADSKKLSNKEISALENSMGLTQTGRDDITFDTESVSDKSLSVG